jgi:hypothetical protein
MASCVPVHVRAACVLALLTRRFERERTSFIASRNQVLNGAAGIGRCEPSNSRFVTRFHVDHGQCAVRSLLMPGSITADTRVPHRCPVLGAAPLSLQASCDRIPPCQVRPASRTRIQACCPTESEVMTWRIATGAQKGPFEIFDIIWPTYGIRRRQCGRPGPSSLGQLPQVQLH